MGNQNQNQNQNNQNNDQNNYSAPNDSNINNENSNTIAGPNNNSSSISSENENPNRIIEESSSSEQNQNQINQNPENLGGDNSAPPNPNGENNNIDCPVPANLSTYEKHFSFNGLMAKIKETAKKAGLKAIYMALLLYYALESPTISIMDKAIIYGALGYFISPIDIVPDILPLIGLSDDIAVLAWAFSRVKHNINDMTREKAKTKLKIWFGNFDEKEIDDL